MVSSPFRVFCGALALVVAAGCSGGASGTGALPSFAQADASVPLSTPVAPAVLYVAYPAAGSVGIYPQPGAASTASIGSNLKAPNDVAESVSGDLYVADTGRSDVIEYKAGNGEHAAVVKNVSATSIALDAKGNLYLENSAKRAIEEYAFNSKTNRPEAKPKLTIPSGTIKSGQIAVDASGRIFVADARHKRVLSVAASATKLKTYLQLTSSVSGIAVAGTGANEQLFVSSPAGVEVFVGGNSKPARTITQGLIQPGRIALSSGGELFVANGGNGGFVAVYASGASAPEERLSGNGLPTGVAAGALTAPLDVTPSSVTFSSPAAQTISVRSGFAGTVSATSSDPTVATVVAGGTATAPTFSLSPAGGGTCTIVVRDTAGDSMNVSVSVNAGVIIIDGRTR
jgi:hypothetical protein